MKALISPDDQTPKYVSSWTDGEVKAGIGKVPVFSPINNAQRVAQVATTEFDVSEPLFWVDCADNVVADEYYYDTSDSTIKAISDLNVAEPT